MYICVCNAVTDKDIKKAVDNGACSIDDLSKKLKVGTCCGRCKSCAKKLLNKPVFPPIQTLDASNTNSTVVVA